MSVPKSELDERRTKKLLQYFQELNRLAEKRRDLLIVGVMTARESELKKLMENVKPRFPIGVRSASYRRFQIAEFPTVRVLQWGPDWDGSAGSPVSDPAHLLDLFAEGAAAFGAPPGDRGHDPENMDTEALKSEAMRLVGDATQLDQLDQMLETLRLRLEPGEFMDYCDRIEPLAQGAAYSVGRIRLQRHLADPSVEEKQSREPPVAHVLQDWRSNKDDPKWDRYRKFVTLQPFAVVG